MVFSCFDVVSTVVDEASSQFAPAFKIDNESYKVLEQYCSAFDSLVPEFGVKSFEVEVHDINMTVAITMECEYITVKQQTHKFLALAKRAESVSFFANGENICVKFVFPSLWVKA